MTSAIQGSSHNMDVERYDYQPIGGSKKRGTPKAGSEHIHPPPPKRAKTSNDGYIVPFSSINHAHLKTEEELKRERRARQRAEATSQGCGKTIRKLMTIKSRQEQKISDQRIAYQQAATTFHNDKITVERQAKAHVKFQYESSSARKNEDILRYRNLWKAAQQDHIEQTNVWYFERKGLQDQGTTLTSRVAALQTKCGNLETANATLTSQLSNQSPLTPDATSEMEINEMQDQMDTLQEQNSALSEQNDEMQHKVDMLREQNSALREQNNALQEQNEAMKRKNRDLKKENKDLMEDNEAIEEADDERGQQVQDLHQKVKKLEDEIKRLNELVYAPPTPPEEDAVMAQPSFGSMEPSPTPTTQPYDAADEDETPSGTLSKASSGLSDQRKKLNRLSGRSGRGRNAPAPKREARSNIKTSGMSNAYISKPGNVAKASAKTAHGGTTKSRPTKLDLSLSKMTALQQLAEEAVAKSPEPEDGDEESEDPAADMTGFGQTEWLHKTGQDDQIIRRGYAGGPIENNDKSKIIYFQKRDGDHLFRAEVTLADTTPGMRKRFLPDSDATWTDEQKECYQFMCILAQLPEVHIEAAHKFFVVKPENFVVFKDKLLKLFGPCTTCEEKTKYPELWEQTVNWLADTSAFHWACGAFVANKRTIVSGVGAWPARYVDPQVKYHTSLQRHLDIPEADKEYSGPVDEAAIVGLNKKFNDEAIIDAMNSLTDLMNRGTDLARGGGMAVIKSEMSRRASLERVNKNRAIAEHTAT